MNKDINQLIAERIMGWKKIVDVLGRENLYEISKYKRQFFNPTENINDAWVVVNKLKQEEQYYFKLENGDLKDYECYFTEYDSNLSFSYEADSPSIAICMAALKTKGITI